MKTVLSILISAALTASGPASAESTQNNDQAASSNFPCLIQPSAIIDIGIPAAGVIKSIHVDRGDSVTEGMILAQLDSGLEQATAKLAGVRAGLTSTLQLRQAQANSLFKQRQTNSVRVRQAAHANPSASIDDETYFAQLRVRQEQDLQLLARLELDKAREALKRRSATSPIDGVVLKRFKANGEWVKDTPVLRLARLDPLTVQVELPVELINQIKPGMEARVSPQLPDVPPQTAKISQVDRVADPVKGSFIATLSLANPEGRLPAGLRCQLRFVEPGPGESEFMAPGHVTATHGGKAFLTSLESLISKSQGAAN